MPVRKIDDVKIGKNIRGIPVLKCTKSGKIKRLKTNFSIPLKIKLKLQE